VQRRRGLARLLDHVAALEQKVPPARIDGAGPCTWHWRGAGAVGVDPASATGIVVDRGVRHDPRVLAVELDQHPGSIGQWLLVPLAVLHRVPTAKDEESPSLLRSDEAHMEADLWPGSHNELIIRSNARAQRMTGLVIGGLPDAALG
jgi:hypothetical protein